ncbi:MAG TPA: alpha/beta fold hydrolase [Woeseiaceae bacterium]|nr:alpha/beta fold hydrolase [Woeseiaceae bacterium]
MFRPGPLLLTLVGLLALVQSAGALELEDCRISAGPSFPGIKARCGKLSRHENPDDESSPLIELKVAVVPALNLKPAPDPVVPIAGGPGQGTVQFYAAYANAFEPLRKDHDILLVDQRGTGESARMDCPVDDELVEGLYSTDQTLEFTKECLASLPHDPRYFTTSIAVRDLDAVREALGYPTLNVYGISYGSRVAQHYARRYPATTRSVVLDGVVPPLLPLGPDIALESQRALDDIFARCSDDEACKEHFGDVATSFDELMLKLDEKPLKVRIANPVTGEFESVRFGHNEMAAALRLLAYSPGTVALIPLLITEAANGHIRPLVAQFQMTVSSLSEAISLGMHNAVMCTEDVPYYDQLAIDKDAIGATYMGLLQLDALQAICSVWPVGVIDDNLRTPLATDIPVLLLSGSADPITPPRYADMAARNLMKAWLLTGKNQGHGQIAVGCMPRIVEDFVAAASLDGVDTDCIKTSFVMPFFLDFAGPAP